MVRLPVPGSDEGTWGDILLEYLQTEHNTDGTHKESLLSTKADSRTIRHFNRKNYSRVNLMESGWSSYYGSGTIAHDSSVFIAGSASLKITTVASSSTPCGGRKTISPAEDWSNKTIKVWVKAENWNLINQAYVVISTSGSYSSSFRCSLKPFFTNPTFYNNEWIELILPQSKFITNSGTPSWSTVNDMMVKVYGEAAGTTNIWFNEFATISNPTKGLISITFDDGHVSQFTAAKPILDRYGYKATNYLIPDYVGTSNYNTQDQVDIEAQSGWDIAGHHQTDLSTFTNAELVSALKSVRSYLNTHGYKGSDLFAYPNGAENPSIIKTLRRYFSSGRTIVDSSQAINYIDPMRIHCRLVHNTDTPSTIQTWIDDAISNNEWLILCFHKIVTPATSSIYYTPTDFGTIVDYCYTKGVPVLPVSEALQKISETRLESTADLPDSSNKRYVTDTQLATINSLSAGSITTPRWVKPYFSGVAATDATPVVGRVFLLQFELYKACTIDGVVVSLGTVSSGNLRVGIYGPVAFTTDTCAGASLVVESSSTAQTATNGPQLISLTQTSLAAGKYYVALQFDNTTARYSRLTNQNQVDGWSQYYDRSGGYGAFTSPCPTITNSGTNMPSIAMRFSS